MSTRVVEGDLDAKARKALIQRKVDVQKRAPSRTRASGGRTRAKAASH